MRKKLLLAVALLAAFSTTASAGVINLDFVGKGSLGKGLDGVQAHFSGGGTYGGSGAWAGLLEINVTGATGFDYNGIQEVYCTELNEYAGQNDDYFLDKLENLSIPSTAPAMGNSQKAAIEKLFSVVGTVSTDYQAAGFQIAVWEISQDANFGDLTTTSTGNFHLTGSGSNFDKILTSANDFLGQLPALSQVDVLGMVSFGSQDFVDVMPTDLGSPSTVPEPSSMAVWGLGLIGLSLRRRRA